MGARSAGGPASDREIVLTGGIANRGLVVRRGETVHKPVRGNSEAVRGLLEHLAAVGFDGAPRYLGTDEAGREVLSYIPGKTVSAPFPNWVLSESTLRSVARLLRRYHDAVADFDHSAYDWPWRTDSARPYEVVNHNDPNLDNVVFRAGEAVALIDFDLAGPGSRLWDVAAAARLWAPLRPDRDIPDRRRGQALRRFGVIVAAYGLEAAQHAELLDAVTSNHDWLYGVIATEAAHGHADFGAYWRDAAERIARTREWYETNRDLLLEALATSG